MRNDDAYRCWYASSNTAITNVVPCDLDNNFQGKKFEIENRNGES